MESCCYRNEEGTRCGSKFNSKEVEFRHPDYKDLTERVFLCENHFANVFGQLLLTTDHILPLNEDEYLKRQWLRERDRFVQKEAEAKKKVRDGIGNENFDWGNWYAVNKRPVDDAYIKWDTLRKNTCRFEWCKGKISNFRKAYVIRVYPKNPNDYINLLFCSLDHWEVYKKRIGLTTLKGTLNPKESKRPIVTLGDYIDSS